MSELPNGAFSATGGKLGQLIYENPSAGVGPEFRFYLELSFDPFEWEDETLTPLLRIDNISVPAKSFRDLEGTSPQFPYAPKPGSVEAAVLLFGEHNPADVTRIEFGAIEEGKLRVGFETEVDFEIEADRDDLEQIEMSFDLAVAIDPLRISTSLEKRCEGDPEQIREVVAEIVDLSCYGELEKLPGGFALPVA